MPVPEAAVIEPDGLEALVVALHERGFRVLGPTVRDGAIVYDDLESAADLPIGWTDEQDAGRYRLERRDDEARFGYAVGPHSWKQFLLPPRIRLWRARARDERLRGRAGAPDDTPLALLRRARLRASRDRHPGPGAPRAAQFVDRDYAARRKDAFIVAVNCFEPGGTCFCVSMGTGPKAEAGYDLALTEILDGAHRFLVEVGTDARRRACWPSCHARPPSTSDRQAAAAAVDGAAAADGPQLDTDRPARAAGPQPRARPLGRGRVALPDLRQLHDGLPDVLLHDASRMSPTWPARRPSGSRLWDSCFSRRPLLHPRRQRPPVRPLALPPVADAQVRHLARPVRHARAASAAAAASPGARSGIDVTEELTAIRATEEASREDD